MADHCPKCGRVAQKGRPDCLYCGAPLDAVPEGDAASEAPASSEAVAPSGEAASPEEVAAPASPPPGPEPRAAARPTPADEARAMAGSAFETGPSRSILRSGFLWLVLVAVAIALGALVAQRSGEEEPVAVTEPSGTEDLSPPEDEDGVLDPAATDEVASPEALESRTAGAQRAIARISQWIEDYALEYGHYPAALGLGLDALVQFSEGADLEAVLASFEGGRLEYSRSVAAGGEEESFVLRGIVAETGGREVTARGSRVRGGAPRNPAPLQ